jgi:metallo-beta-lactamase class B
MKLNVLITLLLSLVPFKMAFSDSNTFIISPDLEIIKLTDGAYITVSYTNSPQYGRFPSNSMLLIQDSLALMIDTPVNDHLTELLLHWISENTKARVKAIIITHWHDDRLGGLNALQKIGVHSYSLELTRKLAAQHNYTVPEVGFRDSLILTVGKIKTECRFLGAGHTLDNIVVWIPGEKILFGGCLVKAADSKGPGNIADADMSAWPETIKRVQLTYPDAAIIVPGHGASGGIELLDHTYKLLVDYKAE